MKMPKELSLEDAQKIAEESDYAFAASGTDCNPINWGDAAAFVLEGYKACFTELTCWNDPKEVLPEYYKAVEIKYRRPVDVQVGMPGNRPASADLPQPETSEYVRREWNRLYLLRRNVGNPACCIPPGVDAFREDTCHNDDFSGMTNIVADS